MQEREKKGQKINHSLSEYQYLHFFTIQYEVQELLSQRSGLCVQFDLTSPASHSQQLLQLVLLKEC